MLSSPGRYFVLLVLVSMVALPLRSQETPSVKQTGSKKTDGTEKKALPAVAPSLEIKKPLDAKKTDLVSLPVDAVLVLCERAKDALDLIPKAVLLTPEKYQEMHDEIERLKKLLTQEKPAAPTRCLLRGQVRSGAIHLEVEFDGMAEQPNTIVTLACPEARASKAETDGRMALIRRSESGSFLVRIEKAGEYHIKLDLLVPLEAREGNGREFELTLPRAVITQLELDLPPSSKDVRVGGRTLDEPQLRGLKWNDKQHLSGNPGLEPVDKLTVSWKEIRPSTGGDPVRTAEGRIEVRVHAAGQTTEADLMLKVEGAPTDVWRLLVPLKAEVKVLPLDDPRIQMPIEKADQNFASVRTIHLKEPSSDPLHVRIQVPLVPRNDSLTPVGPFFVLDAARQMGTVEVRNSVRTLHLDYHAHGDIQLRRQQLEEGTGKPGTTVDVFEYSNISILDKPNDVSGPQSLSWLDIEAQTVLPRVRTRVWHTLTLRQAPSSLSRSPAEKGTETRRWEIVTTIAPVGTRGIDLDQLKVFLPPEWRPLDESIAVIPGNPSPHTMLPTTLLREATSATLRLEGRLEASYQAEGRMVVKLPRPQGIIDSCEVRIETPAEVEAILNDADHANLELVKQQRPNEQTWRCRDPLANDQGIDVSWRPYRPGLRVLSVIDLTLQGNHGEVRHELKLHVPTTPPPFLQLRVPSGVTENLRVEGERPEDWHEVAIRADGTAQLPISPQESGKEWRRVLHYRTRWKDKEKGNDSGSPFAVPLVVPEETTSGDIRVRIWSEAGFLPRPAADPHWEESNIEEVKDRPLPVLVLHTTKLDAPLRLVPREQTPAYSVLIEGALLRVQLLEGGVQNWHCGFLLRQLAERDLEVLLPGPVAALNARFHFNRRGVTPDILNDQGDRSGGGSIARLHLAPDLVRPSALLEVSFQSLPSRTGRTSLHTILQPPQVRGAPAVPTRWQVSVPANSVLLAPESASEVERSWARRGWLLAARLQASSIDGELERSFQRTLSDRGQADNDLSPFSTSSESTPALVCWQDHTAPILLTHAPQQGWLLVCSLGVLLGGLTLSWSARPRSGEGRTAAWLWPLLALFTLAVAVAALFWPTMLSAIVYGSEPGILVLLVVLGLQWLRHERYRRQIVFLPSFSRSHPGSSVIRNNVAIRPHTGEPSTVDIPPVSRP